jgi:hypothetical protein
MRDPMASVLDGLAAADTVELFSNACDPVGLFKGAETADAAYALTQAMLEDKFIDAEFPATGALIIELCWLLVTPFHLGWFPDVALIVPWCCPGSSHGNLCSCRFPGATASVGDELTFDTSVLAPIPIMTAVNTTAAVAGWHAEALLQGVCVNTGWLEHHATRIRLRPGEAHERTPLIPGHYGAPPSNGKSSLLKWITKYLLDFDFGDLDAGMKCMVASGTVRGHRNNLYAHRRSGLASSEVTETYKTSATDSEISRSLLANKSMVCKWVNSEDDASITGLGTDNHPAYLFYHLVSGQIPYMLEVLSIKNMMGYPKRFHLVLHGHRRRRDTTIDSASANAFLKDLMRWMAKKALPVEGVSEPDAFASQLLARVQEAVDDFQEAHPNLPRSIVEKLGFCDTEISRFAHVQMRFRQFLVSCSGLGFFDEDDAPVPMQWSVTDLMYGLQNWARQLSYYAALVHETGGRGGGGDGPGGGLEEPDVEEPSSEELLMKWIVENMNADAAGVASSSLRVTLKTRLANLVKPADDGAGSSVSPTELLHRALDGLVNGCILTRVSDTRGQRRGHRTQTVAKRPWSEVRTEPLAKRLRLSPW